MHAIFKVTALLATLTVFICGSDANGALRTCYTCKGVNCLRTSSHDTQQCQDPLDYCVTIFDKFNVVQKGCSLEIPIELRKHCDTNGPECHKCNVDRCNDLGRAEFMCLECDSSKEANCATNPAAITATRCSSPTAPNSYCYVKYENALVKRGCATTVAAQQTCYADGNCLLCSPNEIQTCNSVNFTPLAATS